MIVQRERAGYCPLPPTVPVCSCVRLGWARDWAPRKPLHPPSLDFRGAAREPCAPLPAVCGLVLEKTGSFTPIFQATAVLYILGTVVWNAFCTGEQQFA